MLLRFGVSNHLSIRDFQELSFSASSLKDPDAGLIPCTATPVGSVVPAAVIYGANASGKSNLVDALKTMRAKVLYSHTQGTAEGGVPRHSFALDPAYVDSPSRFEIDFVLNGERLHYGFEMSDRAFESEWLHAFPKSYRRLLFERDGNEFHFGRWLKGRNNTIKMLTRRNSLYLSAAAQSGHDLLTEIYGYFQSIRDDRYVTVLGSMASAELATDDPDRRLIEFLRKMDAGVIGYRRRSIEITEKQAEFQEDLTRAIKKVIPDFEGDSNLITFELAHPGRNGDPVYLELERESAGTRRLLILLGSIFRALDDGTPIVVDELDASLHTQAAEAVLELFSSSETNPKGAQIVATTHNTNLMNSPILRRDQIWFTEKDDSGGTRLYPLTDIRTRKGDNIERGYLQDRYGATPRGLGVMTLAPPR